ncbi:MAG: hypothetical protein GY943_13595 [Chloroflexi bacterium]|nr:hypothetical protein [Chloroflexota bacterium]
MRLRVTLLIILFSVACDQPDIVSETWRLGATMPTPRSEMGAADLEMYDPDVAGSIDNQGRVLILD